jgi:hypothetical protein
VEAAEKLAAVEQQAKDAERRRTSAEAKAAEAEASIREVIKNPKANTCV